MSASIKRRLNALQLAKRANDGPQMVLILECEGMDGAAGLLVSHDGLELRIDRHDGEHIQALTARAKAQGAGLTLVQYLPEVAK